MKVLDAQLPRRMAGEGVRQSAYLLVASCAVLLAGCRSSGTADAADGNLAEKIVGRWEMVEDRDHPRHNPPTETIEFTQKGSFVMRMAGKVEMEGRFRIEKDKVILTHADGQWASPVAAAGHAEHRRAAWRAVGRG